MSTTAITTESMAAPVLSERELFVKRRGRFIGSSDAGSLFNTALDDGYGCTRKLVWDKQGKEGIPFTPYEQEILRRGTMLEPVVAQYFVEDTGLRLKRTDSRMLCPGCGKRYPYTAQFETTPDCTECGTPVSLGANLDRIIYAVTKEDLVRVFGENFPWFIEAIGDNPGPGYLEIKTANEFAFKSNDQDGMPIDYLLQMQHGLAASGYAWGVFAVMCVSHTLERRYFPVLRNQQLIDAMMHRTKETWKAVQGEAPLPDLLPEGKDEQCGSCKYRKDCRSEAYLMQLRRQQQASKVLEADDSLSELVSDLVQIQAEKKTITATEDNIKTLLKEKLGDRQQVAVPSTGKRVDFKDQKGGEKWDTGAIEAILPKLTAEDQKLIAGCKMVTPGIRALRLYELKQSQVL